MGATPAGNGRTVVAMSSASAEVGAEVPRGFISRDELGELAAEMPAIDPDEFFADLDALVAGELPVDPVDLPVGE